MTQGDIAPIKGARANEVLQLSLGIVIFCRKHETRGVPVQAMHDTRPVLPLHRTEMIDSAVVHKGIGERARIMAVGGMTHKTALLGQHDQVIVLKANIQRDSLGNDLGAFVKLRQLDRNAIAS